MREPVQKNNNNILDEFGLIYVFLNICFYSLVNKKIVLFQK